MNLELARTLISSRDKELPREEIRIPQYVPENEKYGTRNHPDKDSTGEIDFIKYRIDVETNIARVSLGARLTYALFHLRYTEVEVWEIYLLENPDANVN